MTKDSEAAQDFTQDIFLKVYDKFDTFQNRSTFSTWLYSVSHNYCLDQIRHGKRVNLESLTDDVATELAEQDHSASDELRFQALESMVNCLPAQEVTFLRLKHEQGLSIKEISALYNLKECAVKMRLKRSRDKLNKLYNSQEV